MRAVKQKVWNEAEARAVRARKTLTPRFTDFFTGFEENRLFCSLKEDEKYTLLLKNGLTAPTNHDVISRNHSN